MEMSVIPWVEAALALEHITVELPAEQDRALRAGALDACLRLISSADNDPPLRAAGARALRGRAVQVDPIKPKLKAPGCPGTNRLKVYCDELLSSFGFNFNLRRYSVASCYRTRPRAARPWRRTPSRQGLTLLHFSAQRKHNLWDTLGA
jgi:hypothetical protein